MPQLRHTVGNFDQFAATLRGALDQADAVVLPDLPTVGVRSLTGRAP
jgi:hypothetical protein